jgi:hypothetical protein
VGALGRTAVAAIALAVGVVGLTVLLAARASFATSIGDSELARSTQPVGAAFN